jgi:predicted  nucleic acid-binding Zn-ribbon protein
MGGYKLNMTGDELEMLDKHEKILTEQVLPDIESLKGIASTHAERMKAYEDAQMEAKNQQQALANDLQGVKNDIQGVTLSIRQMGQDLKEQNSKMFDHILGLNTIKTQNESAVTIAKLGAREKIIVALFGAGGLSGIIAAAVTFLGK